MATRDDTQPASDTSALDQAPVGELRIRIHRDSIAWFEGTAASLIAEGLVPDGLEWPRGACTARFWEANGLRYQLRRQRPDGHKGPMKSWLELDNWCVLSTALDREWSARTKLERKAEELRAEYRRRLTAAGAAEWEAEGRRYWAAFDDRKFQAFKALIPGLIPPRRGRKAKSAALKACE
jgi:hypothetical protein